MCRMNRSENLLVTTAEECAEIQQAISKGLRFGLQNKKCKEPFTSNEAEILKEYYHLVAMVEMLQDEGCLRVLSEEEQQAIKKEKKYNVESWMETSRNNGTLTE